MIVNSWNEWDPLREVVVGAADHACFEPTEPGSRPRMRGASAAQAFPTGPKPHDMTARANAELDGLADLLTEHGVAVRRPAPHDFAQPVTTPTFTIGSQYCAVCPRDVMITVGHEIVEATMSRRARYFEYLAYRSIVYACWHADPATIWTTAPKPTMAERMYREDFWDWPMAKRWARMHDFEFCVTQDEVIFDAADIVRFGRDIFVQESMTTNRTGIE